MQNRCKYFALLLTALVFSVSAYAGKQPNIMVIMTDDMGFSDLGSYGSEIETPHLDALAADGLRFQNFYNSGRCWPTRTSLMTGYHLEQITGGPPFVAPDKRAALTARLTSLPEMLKQAGYRSYHTGKWHVGALPKVIDDAGFAHSFAFHNGENHFRPRHRTLDDQPYPNKDEHVTDSMTDSMIEYLKGHAAQHPDAPFFSYLAFYAPHWPLHAKAETIEKYAGVYDAGWDALRRERLERMKAKGFPETWGLADLEPEIEASGVRENKAGESIYGPHEIYTAEDWETLSDETKALQSLKMQIHAAMVDEMDQAVGRVIEQLKVMGELDNTLIFFLSDNGASAEIYGAYPGRAQQVHDREAWMGGPDTHLCLGPGFAAAANTPLRRYKMYTHEGGVATPLLAYWPKGIDPALNGRINERVGHVVDLVATILDVAGVDHPKLEQGAPALPGRSFAEAFAVATFDQPSEYPVYFSHNGNRGLRMDNWKLVSAKRDQDQWALYDFSKDRSERQDLAAKYPEKLNALIEMWQKLDRQYVEESKLTTNVRSSVKGASLFKHLALGRLEKH